MRLTLEVFSALLVPVSILATPTSLSNIALPVARQAQPAKPKPCIALIPPPTANITQARFNDFAQAFIYTKNITKAFEYISQDYINHNPAAQNGFDSAWNILSPIWASQNITPIRTTYEDPQGWLNYNTGSFGEVVDRFRWAGGCIAEHWDQGEVYPTT